MNFAQPLTSHKYPGLKPGMLVVPFPDCSLVGQMTTSDSALDSRLNNTVGCAFIGILFELMCVCVHGPSTRALCVDEILRSLYGFSIAQTQYYFHEYPCDRLYIQIVVRFTDIGVFKSTSVDGSHLRLRGRWHYYGK